MRYRPDSSKKRRRYKQVSLKRKLEIARWIVDHPDQPIKQVAADQGISRMMCYRIVYDFLDVRKHYAFKRPTEPTE